VAESIFALLRAQKKKDTALHFASACQSAAPDEPRYLLLLARAKVLAGKTQEAVVLLQRAQQKEADGMRRRDHRIVFLLALADAGKAVEGYQGTLDARAAFAALAPELQRRKDFAALRRLVELTTMPS
jgi:hypothetical protein